MRKKSVYLDTSVVSYLLQEDAPEKCMDTRRFWDELRIGKYDVYISDAMLGEVCRCQGPKRWQMLDFLNEVSYTVINTADNVEIKALAGELLARKVLPPSCGVDALHIAAAMWQECDMIVSWNFKHIVTKRAMDGVRMVSLLNGMRSVDIYAPCMLLEDVQA